MAARPLSGAREKLRRAKHHIDALEKAYRNFLADRPYRFATKTDAVATRQVEVPKAQAAALGIKQYYPAVTPSTPDHTAVPLRLSEDVGIYIVRLVPLPATSWGAHVGDVVHNLRSALDQLAWELSVHSIGSSFPNSRQNSHLNEEGNISDIGCWLLNELWNRDKHRSITVATDYTAVAAFALSPAEGHAMTAEQFHETFEVKPLWAKPVGRFADGMRVAQFRITRKRPGFPEAELEVVVETQLALGVMFSKAPPTYGEGVFDVLKALATNVERVLDGFQGDFN